MIQSGGEVLVRSGLDQAANRDFHRSFVVEPIGTKVVFGRGRFNSHLVSELDELGFSRILLVGSSSSRPLLEAAKQQLSTRVAAVFDGSRQHVPGEVTELVVPLASEYDCDGIVAIGGGSAIGAAKIVALKTGLSIIAVPTTYSGSEMTPVWGMTEGDRKVTGRDPKVAPKTVIYDPDLLQTLSKETAAASSLNALAHCVEALWAQGASPLSDSAATRGISEIMGGLDRIAGGDAMASEQLLVGSYLAGLTLAMAGSGLHHKICHVLGGMYDLPHAKTHAVLLPYVLAYNFDSLGPVRRMIEVSFATDDPVGRLVDLYLALGGKWTLEAIGMPNDGVRRVAAEVQSSDLSKNPRSLQDGDVERIIEAARVGADPHSLKLAHTRMRG